MSLFEAPFPAGPEMKSSFLRCGVWIATFEMAVLDEFDKRIEWLQLDEKKNSSIIHQVPFDLNRMIIAHPRPSEWYMSTTINYSIFTKSSLIVFVSCPVLKLQVFDTDLLAVSFPTLSNALNACQVQDACSNSSSSFGVFPTSAQYWARKRRWISIFKHPWCNKYESECLLKEELELIGPVTKTTPFQRLRQIPTHGVFPSHRVT